MSITQETRRESNQRTDKETRKREILVALGSEEMTARELLNTLHYFDINSVRPRLTELCQEGVLETVEGKKKYDPVTDRYTAIYRRKQNA